MTAIENYGGRLLPQHQAMLAASGISPERAQARGYRSIGKGDRVRLKELKCSGKAPGLLVPLLDANGKVRGHQYRPDDPEPGKPKYLNPMGQRNMLDIPAGVGAQLDDPEVPLWITEGSKKADAAAEVGLCCISVSGVWNWRTKNRKGGKTALAEFNDIALNDRQVVIAYDGDAARKPSVQKAMRALADYLGTKGARVQYLHLPDEADKVGLDDYLQAGHTVQDLRALVKAGPPALVAQATKAPPPPTSVTDSPQRLDDAHLADWMAHQALGQRWCWAGGLGWLRWTGKRWKPAAEAIVVEAVRRAIVDLHHSEASAGASIDRLRKLDGLLSAHRIRAVTSLVRGVAAIEADKFDQQPDLLNVGNGTVDLSTGELGPHDPRHLLTKITTVNYRPGCTHEDWDQALTALPPEVGHWLQARLGQAATGYPTPDDVMPVLQGGGSNGKSTVLGGVRAALGEHAVQVPDRVLTANPSDHPTELMTLFGARLATIEETPEAQHLNVQRLKATVGTPTMNARRIRQDNVQWQTTHSLVLASNYRPRVDESDHGTWRRLALVAFPYRFPQGNGLRERVERGQAQREAVLSWLVAGAVRWYAQDQQLPPAPAAVLDATAQWRGNSDRILGFIRENIVFDAQACIATAEMFTAFNEWLTEAGHREWSDQTFTDRFAQHSDVSAHGVVKSRPSTARGLVTRSGWSARTGRVHVWLGVRWRTESDSDDEDETPGQEAPDQGGPGYSGNSYASTSLEVHRVPQSTPVHPTPERAKPGPVTGTCTVCGNRMTIVLPDQTTHIECEPNDEGNTR